MYRFYKNNKNGKIYLQICECIDCTNETDGRKMIYYMPVEYSLFGDERYVRDKKEFEEKFTLVKESDVWPTEELYKKFN